MSEVDDGQVRHLAELSQVALTDDEVRQAQEHLERLLAYIEQLQGVDVTDAEEAVHFEGRTARLRADVPRPSSVRDAALAAAADAGGGFFRVPRVPALGGDGDR